MWHGVPYVKEKAVSPHKEITEDRIIEEGTLLYYFARSYRAFDVKVNLKPGVKDPYAESKTHITVSS